MPKRNRAREARKGAARAVVVAQEQRERLQADVVARSPRFAMSDAAWEFAHNNGNPLPIAACGGRHRGRCCGCGDDYCCYRW